MKHTLLLILILTGASLAQTNYVALDGLHVLPFTNWLTAATNIQDAVDIAQDGDVVLVMTGAYASGGRPAPGQSLTNRLVVTNCITVQSVFGPQHTIIAGAPDPVLTNGPQAVRGAYLANGATLSGFTITRGCTSNAGTNEDLGGGVFMVDGASLSHCHIVSNVAIGGGGVCVCSGSSVTDCTIDCNNAIFGAGLLGMSNVLVIGCLIISNYNDVFMGPTHGLALYLFDGATVASCRIAYSLTSSSIADVVYGDKDVHVVECDIYDNLTTAQTSMFLQRVVSLCRRSSIKHSRVYNNGRAEYAVELKDAQMADCDVYNNKHNGVATSYRNEVIERSRIVSNYWQALRTTVASARISDCLICYNRASSTVRSVYNCTFYANGEDVAGWYLYNCIISNNTSTSYWYTSYVNCCLQHTNGIGTITGDPLFCDAANGDFRLRRDSPCINAGTNMAELGAWDVAGQARVRGYRVDMGAYEFSTTGPCVAVTERVVDFGNVVVGDTATNAVRVVNLGDEPVIGTATGAVAPFAISAGADYSVQTDAFHDVTLTFTPVTEGVYSNVLLLRGGGDERVVLRGAGVPEPRSGIVLLLVCLARHTRPEHQESL